MVEMNEFSMYNMQVIVLAAQLLIRMRTSERKRGQLHKTRRRKGSVTQHTGRRVQVMHPF
jgi:hypothetical protein